MKNNFRMILLIILIIVFALLSGCTKINESVFMGKDIREIVWSQLSVDERNEIIGTWKDGKIEKDTAKKDSINFRLEDPNFDGKEVYLITFKSKYEPVIGNVQKLVDIKSRKIVGTALRN